MASLGNRFSLTCSYPRTQPQPRHSWAIYSRERKAYVHAVTYTHVYSCFIQNSPKLGNHPAVLQRVNGYNCGTYVLCDTLNDRNELSTKTCSHLHGSPQDQADEEQVSFQGSQCCEMCYTDRLGMRNQWEGDQAWGHEGLRGRRSRRGMSVAVDIHLGQLCDGGNFLQLDVPMSTSWL